MMKKFIFILSITSLFLGSNFESFGQLQYPPEITGANIITYKNIDDIQLNLWIFNPPRHQVNEKKPAIVFFFGGGWNGGSPGQFKKHCEYLAARGMVSIVADYRVRSRHNVLANKCVSDAKSAIRWVRENASKIGVDPNRIVASGGSAGGHLAAATATLTDFDEPSENNSISSIPNALVLFNPVVVLAPVEIGNNEFEKKLNDLEKRLGAKAESMSPYHNIKSGIPPTIIFHGTADSTVPFKTVEIFAKKMKESGNYCDLVAYQDESHGFFNYGKKSNGAFIDTVNKMDIFLASIGYLKAAPKSIVK